jgi:hypothetical protein
MTEYCSIKKWTVYIILLSTVYSCNNTKKDLSIFDKKKLNQEESKNVVSYLSQAGLIKARLSAPLMIRYTSDSVRVEFTKGLHTEFFLVDKERPAYLDTNIVESHIFSKFGRYTEFNNKVYIWDSVVCYNAIKKDTLWCDDLWWDQDKQLIYTWGKFRFKTHDGQDMHGDGEKTGFTAKQDLSEYTLYKSKGVMVAPQGSLPQ